MIFLCNILIDISNQIADSLLKSCDGLLNRGVISKNKFKQCLEDLGGTSDTIKKIEITEKKIFTDSRDVKEGKYDEFIKSVKLVLNESFSKYNEAVNNNNTSEQNKYWAIIVQVMILMNNIIDWIQNLSLNRHKDIEDAQYQQLIKYYNQIDLNRKEIETVQKHILTLNERDIFQKDKETKNNDRFNKSKNILVALIIFNIIAFVIIFLIYFI